LDEISDRPVVLDLFTILPRPRPDRLKPFPGSPNDKRKLPGKAAAILRKQN
jgi:hypothetical protein